MKITGLLIAFLALSLLVLPGLTAQEKKTDDAKADKTDKKDGDKTDSEKPVKKKEEKLEHGPVLKTKILSMKSDSSHDFTVEVPMPDPQQMQQMQVWQMQQMQQLSQIKNPMQYAQRMQQIQNQLAQWQAQGRGYTRKPVDMRATETCKVRIMYPPMEYNEEGKLKKWTKKELAALKGNSKLPGYESNFESLKVGQLVEVYLAKQHGSPKDKWPGAKQQKKKKGDDDPPAEPMAESRPEVVLIVIHAEPMGR